MNNCGRSLLRAEWSRTTKKLNFWLFGILLVLIRIVGQAPKESKQKENDKRDKRNANECLFNASLCSET